MQRGSLRVSGSSIGGRSPARRRGSRKVQLSLECQRNPVRGAAGVYDDKATIGGTVKAEQQEVTVALTAKRNKARAHRVPREGGSASILFGGREPKRPKVEPIRNPTLFEMEKLDKAAELAGELKIERPVLFAGDSSRHFRIHRKTVGKVRFMSEHAAA